MKRRGFLKGLVTAAAAAMISLQLTDFGNDLVPLDLSVDPTPAVISWQSWEEIGMGRINPKAFRKLELYRG